MAVEPPLALTASGYSFVLPPGWRRIPVRSGAEKAIRAAAREACAVQPRDAPPDRVGRHRMELERRLTAMARQARGNGGIDLCLPVVPVYGMPLAASFTVSELVLASPADPAGTMAVLAAEDGAGQPVTIDGADGLRVERTSGPVPGKGAECGSRQVDYLLAVPGNPGRWLAIVFSTLGAGNPDDQIAVLLTGLFDAIMSTFRWGRADR